MPFLNSSEFYLLMDNSYTADPKGLEYPYPTLKPVDRYVHISLDGLKMLRDAGIQTTMPFKNVWDETEIEPGVYDWSYLDEYCNKAAIAGMKTILFTCTNGYPARFPDDWFVKDAKGVVHRECLSPWNKEAMDANCAYIYETKKRYSCKNCLVASAQLSVGETVLLNEPVFYDDCAIMSFKRYADTDELPTPDDPRTEAWLLESYLEMLTRQQGILVKNEFREIFIMLHPAIADFAGLYGNGNKWIEEILYELKRVLDPVKINHIYYTWIQWPQYWPLMNRWRMLYEENVFGGAEYSEGIPMTTPNAIAQGLRGQIISPCYPGIHDNGVEPWMVANIKNGMNMWLNSRKNTL